MTSQDHVTEGSFDLISAISSLYVTTLPILMAIDIVAMEMCF